MNKTNRPRVPRTSSICVRLAGAKYCRITAGLAFALLSATALAAPQPILPAATQVPFLGTAALGVAALLFAVIAGVLALRLRRVTEEIEHRVASLREDNNKLHRQLQSSASEQTARQRELMEARRLVEQRHQEKVDMLAVISHHLRQPLDALHSTLNLLALGNGDGEGELIGNAQRQLQRALRAVKEIQNFGELETVEMIAPAAPAPAANKRAALSILLVESGEHDSLYTALQIRGHRVQQESNGVDGADAALQKPFDLVLIDARLPLMDGVEATQKIRRGAGRELPIFAMVAGLQRGDKERYQAHGLTGVLARPVTEHQLEQLLNWTSRRQHNPSGDRKPARPSRLLNTDTLCRQRDTLGQLPFAELLIDRCAALPRKITALTSALTGRHWLDARKMAQAIAVSAEEIGLEAVAARLRDLAARLSIDGEREYCRHQRTEILNLMRTSIEQLKAWRTGNMHTEQAQ